MTDGLIAGIDFSQTMVAAARRRNKEAVHNGRVDLRYGDASALPFSDHHFDKVFSIHSIYFWPQPVPVLQEVFRVLKPGGIVILTLMPRDKMGYAEDGTAPETAAFKPYSGEQLCAMLREAGFTETTIKSDPENRSPSNYSVVGIREDRTSL